MYTMPGGKAATMTAGVRTQQRANPAIPNYGDKKNGGANTVGNIVFNNKVLSSRPHPWIFASRGGLIVGGVGMLHADATKSLYPRKITMGWS
jgi:hypothetical protein